MNLILICSVFFFLSPTIAQKTCKPGSFRTGITCKTCPPGTFSSGHNRLSCTKCPKRTFRSNPGAKSRRQCRPCPAGTANNLFGAASCKPCPPGLDSLPFARLCARCPPGYELSHDPFFTSAACVQCEKNFYSPKRGTNKCLRCLLGTVAPKIGAVKCDVCPPGTFRSEFQDSRFNSAYKCKPCPRGMFSNKPASRVCARCPLGTFSEIQATKCTPCPRNMFSNRIPARKCQKCPPGTTTAGVGAASCKTDKKGCPFGTFQNESGICKACSPGERLEPGRRKCVPCGGNEVSDGGSSTVCKTCPPGKIPLSDRYYKEKFECICAPGTIEMIGMGCVPCPVGSFWVDGAFDDSRSREEFSAKCELCQPGMFADKPGSIKCKECPLDTFSDVQGEKSCQRCPPGFKSPRAVLPTDVFEHNLREFCVDEETGCLPGEFIAEKGGCKVTSCPSRNKFLEISAFNKQRRCSTCFTDQKVVIGTSGIGECVDCSDD